MLTTGNLEIHYCVGLVFFVGEISKRIHTFVKQHFNGSTIYTLLQKSTSDRLHFLTVA